MKARLDQFSQTLVLAPEWNEVDICQMIPGYRYKGREKLHTLPLTWASLIWLRGLLGPSFEYDDDVAAWAWHERQTRIDPSLRWREVVSVDNPDRTDLYPFQFVGKGWMLIAGTGLLGDEMGCGKTQQALTWLEDKQLFPALIICPNSVKWHWEARVPGWCQSGTVYLVDGGTAKGRKILAQAKEDPSAIVIINYEAVRSFSRLAPYGSIRLKHCRECDPEFGDNIRPAQCHVHPKELNGFGFRSVILDEVHKCGDPKSQQTRAVWATAHDRSVEERWGLTGTPDNVSRLWSIMHTIAPLEYPTREKWMDRYALMSYNAFGGTDVVGLRPDTREELYRYLDPRFRRMTKAVVLPQLPPIVREVRYATLPPSQQKSYDVLKEKLRTVLPNGQTYIAHNQLVARTRLMQFAAGNVTVEKPDEDDVSTWIVHIGLPSPKLDVLDEVLDELGDRPFAVACEHVEVASMAAERIGERGIRHQLVAGSVHPSTATQACDDLRAGQIQALVFTHKKGGVGLDMSGAGTLIMLQRTWSLIDEIQTENRAHRIGSERHDVVRIIDIVTRGTVEVKQVERLLEKLDQMEQITRDKQRLASLIQATPSDSEEFGQLVGTLNDLNTRQESLFMTDDLEAMLIEEPA